MNQNILRNAVLIAITPHGKNETINAKGNNNGVSMCKKNS